MGQGSSITGQGSKVTDNNNYYSILFNENFKDIKTNKDNRISFFATQQAGQLTAMKSVRQARNFSVITAVRDLRSVAYVRTLLLWPSKWES